jgi:diguanylate cyclase (GGDEF)-like protein/PAS domain S-box-containing protein
LSLHHRAPQRPPVVLIVDDQVSNIMVLRQAVGALADVHCAVEGPMALAMARRLQPDLILLDIEMPGMDGYAVFAQLRADPATEAVPIIFVTGHDRAEHELAALQMGGVDFLHKPIEMAVARARIHTQLALRLRSVELDTARRDLEEVLHHLPAFVAYWDEQWRNVFCNDVAGSWFGVAAASMQGMTLAGVAGPDNYAAIAPHCDGHGAASGVDVQLRRPDGTALFGQLALVRRAQGARASGVLMLITDVTARKLAEMHLHAEKERIRITLNAIGDAVIATDEHGMITFCNPIAESMTGWQAAEALGQPIERVMPLTIGEQAQAAGNPLRLALAERRIVGMAVDCMLTRRDGRRFAVEDSAAPIFDHDGRLCGAIIVFHDVSEARAMAIKMTHLAHHDALTNLPNRMLLRDRMEQALQQARRSGQRVALLIIDLDQFKVINDSIGYAMGDRLLQQVAQRLAARLRACDTLSRQGGDEFLLLMPEVDKIDDVSAFAQRLLELVREPFDVGAERYDLGASIGVAVFPDDSDDPDMLQRHADSAMYGAKQAGRRQVRFYAAAIERQLQERHQLERSIREALALGQFEVYYQPKVGGTPRAIVGAEALVRWNSPDAGLVSPATFIGVAEETGQIVELGRFVLETACREACLWHAQGDRIGIAVNVSAIQLVAPGFAAMVHATLADTGIDPALLELEITEGVLIGDVDASLAAMAQIKALGVRFALDDFGTGYSSLTYLKRFPIDVLKIDQSFVRDMHVDGSDAAIIDAIIRMADSLHLQVVAEGVETAQQEAALLAAGCSTMQGYRFWRPLSAPAMRAALAGR